MNTTTQHESRAERLVRDLCQASGSEQDVFDTLRSYYLEHGLETLLAVGVEALFLTYARALSCPVPLDTTTPEPSNEGA